MLERTFIHIDGLGAHTERDLWNQGCSDWKAFLQEPERFQTAGCTRESVLQSIRLSQNALDKGHHQFFSSKLGQREAWRAWPEFRNRCVYLDIETNGGMSGDSITCIGLYDGTAFRCLVAGQDLALFPDIISHYSMIVTFFGSGFDIPMIKRAFPRCPIDQIHLDLCPALKRLGYRGGLKKIERQIGIQREDEADGLNGMDAIRLWREFQHGNSASLDRLIAYNREDVVNLEVLAQIAYDGLKDQLLNGHESDPDQPVTNSRPFQP